MVYFSQYWLNNSLLELLIFYYNQLIHFVQFQLPFRSPTIDATFSVPALLSRS